MGNWIIHFPSQKSTNILYQLNKPDKDEIRKGNNRIKGERIGNENKERIKTINENELMI